MATLKLDPEYAQAVAPFAAAAAARPKPAVGDIAGRREGAKVFEATLANIPPVPGVSRTDHHATAPDGTSILIAEFRKLDAPTPAPKTIYHIHGGGMIMGSVNMFARYCEGLASETGYPVFSVEYRLAPEARHPIPIEDCWTGLQWLHASSAKLGVDPSTIIVAGESAGGGLAASLALLARDRQLSPPLLKQVLTFPMLDDRNLTPRPALEPYAIWSADDNRTGWGALVGEDRVGQLGVSEYAAPARAESLRGLPPTYLDVGQLDIFVEENVEFAARLLRADVEVEFHLYPGLPHGFMMFAPDIAVSKAARANLIRALREA